MIYKLSEFEDRCIVKLKFFWGISFKVVCFIIFICRQTYQKMAKRRKKDFFHLEKRKNNVSRIYLKFSFLIFIFFVFYSAKFFSFYLNTLCFILLIYLFVLFISTKAFAYFSNFAPFLFQSVISN